MKNLLKILFVFVFCFSVKCKAQDVINPYITQQVPISYFDFQNTNPNFPKNFIFPPGLSTNFTGEYEINLRFFEWYRLFLNPLLATTPPHPPISYAISFNYEVVSFPFMPECTYSGSCSQNGVPCSTHTRSLSIPVEDMNHFTYNNTGNYFQYHTQIQPSSTDKLYLKTPDYDFFYPFSSGNLGQTPHPAFSLASGGFRSASGLSSDRHVMPHTSIKYFINIHCGPDNSYPVIKTISYTYDNTRGRMRYYPFKDCNLIGGGADQIDVLFYPEILYSTVDYDYDLTSFDPALILPNGTLNYFPLNENTSNGCANVVLPDPTDPTWSYYDPLSITPPNYAAINYTQAHWFNFLQSTSWNMYPCPYALLSSPLRAINGQYFAGMGAPNAQGQITFLPGIKHSYLLDNYTDLARINVTDRTIYNPSEATITANNFAFPHDYTFKTIRGVYPSETEVIEDMNAANGFGNCTTCDLRLIPVKTDLTSENTTDATNFPLSASTNTKHLYASRYYLDNVNNTFPKLTIENCVGLYDCTFDVKEGSTMEFTDYVAHYGAEDNTYTNTANRRLNRFKIQTLGGAVLRNLAPVQYLQNGNITQPTPLHYTATQDIFAGKNVDPDADINALSVNHDYTVQSGADVTLEANNTIYLKEGFSAMSGSTFTAKIATTTLASSGICPDLSINLRLAGTEKNTKKKIQEGIQAFPNPTTGIVKLVNNNMPVMAQVITITDTYGRTVFEKINFNSLHDIIDFSTQPNGVYIAKVLSDGNSKPLRFVVNH